MINIISSQLYKIFRSKMLYILIAISCALPLTGVIIMGSLTELTLNGVAMDIGYDAVSMLRNISIVGSDTNILVIIAIAIIFAKEYSEGTIRNTTMAGNNRASIFGATAISATILMLTIAIPAFLVTCFGYGWTFGFASSSMVTADIVANIFASLIVYLLANMLCVAITLLFVHVTQKVSGSIVFPLLIVLLITGIGSTALSVLVMLGEITLDSMSWIPIAQFMVYAGTFNYGTCVLDWTIVAQIGIISLPLTALLLGGTYLRLRTSNIK